MRRRQLAQNLWIGIKLAIFQSDFELEWVLGGEIVERKRNGGFGKKYFEKF